MTEAQHDQHHDGEHPAPQQAHTEVVNAPLVILTGLALFVAVILTVVIVYQFYNWYTIGHLRELEADRSAMVEQPARTYRAQTIATLDGTEPAWVDHETIQMPISHGIDAVLQQYR